MARTKRTRRNTNKKRVKNNISRVTRTRTARGTKRTSARASAARSVAESRQQTVARRNTANSAAAVAPRKAEQKVTPAKTYRSDNRPRKRCKDRPETQKSGKGQGYVKNFVPWCEKVKK